MWIRESDTCAGFDFKQQNDCECLLHLKYTCTLKTQGYECHVLRQCCSFTNKWHFKMPKNYHHRHWLHCHRRRRHRHHHHRLRNHHYYHHHHHHHHHHHGNHYLRYNRHHNHHHGNHDGRDLKDIVNFKGRRNTQTIYILSQVPYFLYCPLAI